MREIKFRAWDILSDKMRDWDFIEKQAVISVFCCARYVPLQYTGLKDKNGKEIYEGDILKGQYDKVGIIQYYDLSPRSGFGIQYWDEDSLEWSDNIEYSLEVIGNIYENHELLKEAR